MTKQIEADTLRAWLEAQQPVTVLDVRTVAWNAADVPLSDASVHVTQVRRTGKGCFIPWR